MVPSIEPMKVTVAFDPGTSSGKVLATWESDECPYEQMEKHYLISSGIQCLTQSFHDRQFDYGIGDPSVDSCMLSYVDPKTKEKVFYQTGVGATEAGRIHAEERKFEKCLAKVLAFLGFLVVGEIKTTSPIELTLGLLLPLDEFADRRVFAEWLRATVGSFTYDGVTVENIKIAGINIKPEGYGIYKAGGHASTVVINWGHSDLTRLVFKEGSLSQKYSDTYPLAGMHGFMRFLDFPITYEIRAAQLISTAGPKMDSKILKELSQTKTAAEMARLKSAITEARINFWESKLIHLDSVKLNEAEAVQVGGGTSLFFKAELNRFYKRESFEPEWGEATMQEFCERFDLDKEEKANPYIPNLFKDVYGYFCTLPGVEQYEAKTVEVVA